ncbi:MAG: hypothetical protein HY708_08040 [Ignavibacteriae bacterium]|nr:hypothetical protein [Ignavibacteriota bacterium]
MRFPRRTALTLFIGALIGSCGPKPETTKAPSSIPVLDTKETAFVRGHQLYLRQQLDSAAILLKRAVSLDPAYREPIADLGALYYDLGVREPEKSRGRLDNFKRSLTYYAKLDSLGANDSDLYERLSEICSTLEEHKLYLRYAKKNQEAYPYDRQYLNLILGYLNVNDYANAVIIAKDATEKFKESPYIGSYYRQLGRAYMKVDRDQTAERSFDVGLKIIDVRIAALKKNNKEYTSSEEYRRLMDDKVGILISLKGLHQRYRAFDKLERVERQLKEATQ